MTPLRDWFKRPRNPISADPGTQPVSSQSASESIDIAAHVQRGIATLAQPVSDGVRALPGPLEVFTKFSSSEVLKSGVLMTLQYFSVGKHFSDHEVQLFRSLFCVHDPTHGEQTATVPIQQLGQAYREVAEDVDPDAILRLLPQIVLALSAYDVHHGSTYTEEFRTLFLRMANSIVMVDGRITAEEQTRLDRYTEALRDVVTGR